MFLSVNSNEELIAHVYIQDCDLVLLCHNTFKTIAILVLSTIFGIYVLQLHL